MHSNNTQNLENNNSTNTSNNGSKNKSTVPIIDVIMDLPKLSNKSKITNTDLILSIFEICTFNKRYNYECSNNTKAFWDRVVQEGILKKIFKNFKSETLRKYWKIMRQTGNNEKYIEIVRQNENFINNNGFKLLPIINTISNYIITPPKDQTFESYFIETNPKEMKEAKEIVRQEATPENKKTEKKEKFKKMDIYEKEINDKDNVDPKILELDDTIEKLMKITDCKIEEVFRALHGCNGDIKKAYLYLKDSKKYENYIFLKTDDYIIKNLKNKNFYIQLINKKGEENVKERERFLKKKKI